MSGTVDQRPKSTCGAIGVILPPAIGDSLTSIPAVWMIAEHYRAQQKLVICAEDAVALFNRLEILCTEFVADTSVAASGVHRDLECIFDFRATRESDLLVIGLRPRRLFRHAFGGALGGHHYEIEGMPSSALTFKPGWESQLHEEEDLAWAMDAGLVVAALGIDAPTASSLRSVFDRFSAGQCWQPSPSIGPVTLVPGGGADAKKWADANWRELAKLLVAVGLELRVSLGPDDTNPLPPDLPHEVFSCLDLDVLSQRFQESAAVVTNDCGPMHIAATFGCRVIAIFGPTNERIWFPYRGSGQRVVRVGTDNIDRNGVLEGIQSWANWPSPKEVMGELLSVLHGE
jgi:hypothetical protein